MEFEWVMCFTASQAEKNSCTLFSLSFQCTGGMERTLWVGVGGERERMLSFSSWAPAGLYFLEFGGAKCDLEIEFWPLECGQKSCAQVPGLVYRIVPLSLLDE